MRIVLTHIPRTGGTSLFEALKAQEPSAKAREFDSLAELAMISDKELKSFNLISTYLGTKFFERLDDSWQKILIMREPLARAISSFSFNRNAPDLRAYTKPIAASMTFRDYFALRDPAVALQITNAQTWTVLGDKGLAFRREHAHLNEHDILTQAVDRLRLFNHIGFTDSLSDLWCKICGAFNWRLSSLPHLRKGESVNPADRPAEEDLRFHLGLDLELLRTARSTPS